MFQCNPQRTGRSAYSGISTPFLRWSYSTAGDQMNMRPSIDDEGQIYIGSADSNLYCFASTGGLVWSYATGSSDKAPIIAPEGASSRRIYHTAGRTYCLSSRGAMQWSFNTGGMTGASPALEPDGRLVGLGNYTTFTLESTGALSWSFFAEDNTTMGSCSPSVGSRGEVYTGTDSVLWRLGSDGSFAWSFYVGSSWMLVGSLSIRDDGDIYYPTSHGIHCVTPSGALGWSYFGFEGIVMPVTASISADGSIYFGCVPNFYCLSSGGAFSWSYAGGAEGYGFSTSTAAIDSGGSVYAPFNDEGYSVGNLYKFTAGGSFEWSFSTAAGDGVYPPALGTDGRIYYGTYGGTVYALGEATPTPTPRWGYVNFQPAGAQPPPGFYIDDGSEFGERGDYGWL